MTDPSGAEVSGGRGLETRRCRVTVVSKPREPETDRRATGDGYRLKGHTVSMGTRVDRRRDPPPCRGAPRRHGSEGGRVNRRPRTDRGSLDRSDLHSGPGVPSPTSPVGVRRLGREGRRFGRRVTSPAHRVLRSSGQTVSRTGTSSLGVALLGHPDCSSWQTVTTVYSFKGLLPPPSKCGFGSSFLLKIPRDSRTVDPVPSRRAFETRTWFGGRGFGSS